MQHEQDVEWTAFVDAEHVATLSQSGRLVVWKIPEVKAVYELAIVRSSKPALSPGGKYLAALTSAGLVALDAKTGDVKGFYPKAGDRGTVAFRPDGKQIALVSSKRLQVWEFAGGKLYRDIGIGIGPSRSDAVAWPAANYILVASLMAPVIVELGAQNGLVIPLIAVHLFVFYYGIMGDITPPVGLLGEFRMISRVRSVTSRSNASRSNEKSFSSSRGTGTALPPATPTMAA